MPHGSQSAARATTSSDAVLTVNGGSSSIKFALFDSVDPVRRRLKGDIERIGLSDPAMNVSQGDQPSVRQALAAANHHEAVGELLNWLEKHVGLSNLAAVGHRVVHGGDKLIEPQWIGPEALAELRHIAPFDPEHLPGEIALIEAFEQRLTGVRQAACFDTTFHRHLPRVARMLPLPREYEAKGIRRYGFHGLSYAYLMEELSRLDARLARGRLVLAHLGNGASMAAVLGGQCIDTSMSFTPTAGLVMSTRTGDLDPGLVRYFLATEGMTGDEFHNMVNHRSGLLGVSETSSDMRDLLQRQASDPRAREAVEMFCYQARKWIGSFAAALGGLDGLIFAGGIGENAAEVRAGICQGLDFLGIQLSEARNTSGEPVISDDASRVMVRVIRTDEEVMIAKAVASLLESG
ncbi:MAG TPA: acetate/propionate family kinase [Pirellulales bacterium]|nr:acetate/propionate family kinase [Pirellulales bacterium]